MKLRLNSTLIDKDIDTIVELDFKSPTQQYTPMYTSEVLPGETPILAMQSKHRRSVDALHWCVDKLDVLKHWFYNRLIRLKGANFISLDRAFDNHDDDDFNTMFKNIDRTIVLLNSSKDLLSGNATNLITGADSGIVGVDPTPLINKLRSVQAKMSAEDYPYCSRDSHGYASGPSTLIGRAAPAAMLYQFTPRLDKVYDYKDSWWDTKRSSGAGFSEHIKNVYIAPQKVFIISVGVEAGTWSTCLGIIAVLKDQYEYVEGPMAKQYMNAVNKANSFPILESKDIGDTVSSEKLDKENALLEEELILIRDKNTKAVLTGTALMDTVEIKTFVGVLPGRNRYGSTAKIRCNGGPVVPLSVIESLATEAKSRIQTKAIVTKDATGIFKKAQVAFLSDN